MTTPRRAIEDWGRESGPTPDAPSTIVVQPSEPRGAWRILRLSLAWLGLFALLEAIIIMTFMIVLTGNLGTELRELRNPEPAVTGCPFGEEECGG